MDKEVRLQTKTVEEFNGLILNKAKDPMPSLRDPSASPRDESVETLSVFPSLRGNLFVCMSPTATTYTYATKQALANALPVTKEEIWRDGRELGFADNAIRVIEKRYLVRNENGEIIETPKGMFRRLARALAQVEYRYGSSDEEVNKWEQEFYSVLSGFEFTPAGRTITNAGGPTRVVANCIVLHFDDSMDGIFSTLRDASLLQQAGSGLGFAWHLLRPAGTMTVKSRGQSSGPVSFLRAYDHAFGTIKQQCFAKGTRIVTRQGLIPIEEVVSGDETYTAQGWKRVTEVFNNGMRETLRVTLDTGFAIELTPEHKVAVIADNAIALKQVKELTPEDTLLLKMGDEMNDGRPYLTLQPFDYKKSKYTTTQLKPIVQPRLLDEQLAYFLGWFFAEGCVWNQGISFAIADDDRVELLARQLIESLFAVQPRVRKSGNERCRKVDVSSVWVREYLRENGLLKAHAWEIVVPEKILRSPKSVQMSFVAGFFDGDGDNGKNYRISTTSRVFAQQLLLILLNSGIGAKIATTVYQGEHAHWRPLYRLSIIGRESTERFYEKARDWSWKIKQKETVKDFGWIFPFHQVRDLGFSWSNIDRIHDGVRNTISHGALTAVQQRVALANPVAVEDGVDWTGFLPAHVAAIEPVGLQEVYDFEVEDVHMINAGLYTSNSRHGANMGVMRVDHPDILEFIDCKRQEGTIVNFNVSVGLTDEFMTAVRADSKEPWLCEWKGKKIKPRAIKRNNRNAYVSHEEVTLTARELMDKIVDAAWQNGEPGVLFPDAANRTNPVPALGRLEATNPCVTGDTLIATDQGLRRADELAKFGKEIRVATDGRFGAETLVHTSPVVATGIKDVLRVATREGYEVRCTPDHRIMTASGWVQAQALKSGDRLHILNRKGGFGLAGTLEQGRILGWIVGDGTISAIRAVLSFFGDEKRELAPAFAQAVNTVVANVGTSAREYPVGVIDIKDRDEARVMSERLRVWAGQYGLTEQEHKHVPAAVLTGSEDMARGFLQALFTADGSVQDGGPKGASVRLASSYLPLLKDAQRLLLNFGIASRIYENRRDAQMRSMPDGQGGSAMYFCKAQHELVVSKDNLARFAAEVGFLTEAKNAALMAVLSRMTRGPYRELFLAEVESVKPAGQEMVYDLTEPVTHSFVANGIVVHNCGEQWLHDGDVCNLGSINLAKFVKDGAIDEPRLRYATAIATRMLDNVIDVSDFPVEKVNTRFRDNRRVGLGIMGFADMLYQMGVGYNTPAGFAAAEQVMKIVNGAAHETSAQLAQTKGVFPNWKKSIFGPQGQNTPLRNAALTTVAPTGSISMFFNCSSGVEPFFALAYKKENIMGGDSLSYTNPYLEQALKERGLWSEELAQDVMARGTIQHRTDLPEDLRRVYVTAMDISAEDHIRMQAAFQKHTDNSISKTINFPNSATRDDVRVGYMLAWELGCKGGTMYRDGSREEQVLNLNSRQPAQTSASQKFQSGEATATAQTVQMLEPRPRPEVLRGTTYKLKTAYGNLYITINEDEHGPFEVFSQMGKAGGFFAANLEAICRMISLSLRSGVQIDSVIRQIKGIRDPQPIWYKGEMILSLPDAIAQILEKHMKSSQNKLELQWKVDGEPTLKAPVRMVLDKASGDFMDNGFAPACPDCGGVLAFQEGCAKCGACGFSRCG